MSLLRSIRDEKIMLATLGITTLGTGALIWGMRWILSYIRDEIEIKREQPKTQYITQDTEDSLKLNTLDTLLGHYNYTIRETAAKIVCDRAVNDGATIDYLLYGITRPDYDVRVKNLRTLAIITDTHTMPLLRTSKAYYAFVRSLQHCMNDVDHEKLDDRYFDEYPLRDMAEKLCLMFVSQLLGKYGADGIVKAGFVEKWLAKQKWGDEPEEREHNFYQYQYKQNRIADICQRLQESVAGRDALEKARLIPQGITRATMGGNTEGFSMVLSIHLQDGTVEADVTIGEPTPRNLEQSAEEQRLRHRHREAMVLNDGTRPLGRSDIIEREHNTPPP